MELKHFSLFVQAPYFNKNKDIAKLLEYLNLQHPDFPEEQVKKTTIFEKFYPNEPYDDKQIRYLMSNLLKLGEQFLLVQKIKKEPIDASFQLLDEYNQRRLDKHYAQLRKKTIDKIGKQKCINTELLFQKIKLSDLDEHHFALQHNRRFDDNIQTGSDTLNQFFVLKKLKYACAMLDRQALLKGDYKLGIPKGWISWIQANDFFGQKIIEIYVGVFKALKNEKDYENFKNLKELLFSNPENITSDDMRDLFFFSINYCIRKIRKGEDSFRKEALDLYLKGIETKVILDNNQLSPWTFGNIVKLSFKSKDSQWIEHFIERNIHLLPPHFQQNALQYNLAELYFFKGDFEKALTQLIRVEFSDLVYQLGSRTMLAKIYTELDEKDALFSLLSAFSMFLKRNKKISDNIRTTYLNFCQILSAIARNKRKDIKERINQTKLLTDRSWLLSKVKGD